MVSVLLPVRNGMPYLPAAMQSIFDQDFCDFEFIIVNDGSTDTTLEYLNEIKDERLKVFTTKGIGLVDALNLGLQECKGKYVARMDADDISLPQRLQIQLDFLERNPTFAVVCSDIIRIDEAGCRLGVERSKIQSNDSLRQGLLGRIPMKPIVHPSAMIRTSVLNEIKGYRHYHAAEDRDLWLRLVDRCNFHRIEMPLLQYRVTSTGISRMQKERQAANALLAVVNYQVCQTLGLDFYEMYPTVVEDFRRICIRHVALQSAAISDSENLKKALRSKDIYNSLKAILIILNNRSVKSIPYIRRRSDFAMIEKLVFLAKCFNDARTNLSVDIINEALYTCKS